MGRLAATAVVSLLLAAVPASAQATIPACAPGPAAVAFDGLPRELAVGERTQFSVLADEFDADLDEGRSLRDVSVVMRDRQSGRPFFTGELDAEDLEDGRDLFIELDRTDGPAEVLVSYTVDREVDLPYDPDAYDLDLPTTRTVSCRQEIRRTVRPVRRYKLPGLCQEGEYRPRLVVIACGDGGYRLQIRWRRWNRPVATGVGRGIFNTCDPYCAAGRFVSARARFTAYRLRRCGTDGYQYTRLKVQYTTRPPGNTPRVSRWKFACDGYPNEVR